MRNSHYYTIVFNSTHHAIAAEKYLQEFIPITVIPTLRKITASCGISIRVEPENYEKALELIISNQKLYNNCSIYEILDEDILKLDI